MNSLSLKVRRFTVFFAAGFLLSGMAWAQKPAAQPTPSPDEVHQLWAARVTPMLSPTMTSSANTAYYDGEVLMVPLHAAFKRKDAAWEQEFSDHFRRLVPVASSLTDVTLSRLQYLYLVSQFIVLAGESGHADMIPAGLPDLVFSQIRNVWVDEPAAQYAHPPFHGMKERLLYKLDHKNLGKSYYRAILDAEFFEFAIAGDLRAYGGTPAQQQSWKSTVDDILAIAGRTCKQEIVPTPEGGWVLQPGVFTDHPDWQYAGNPRVAPGLRPAPVRGIGWDSSHFARWALFIRSLMSAFPEGSPWNRYYFDLENDLKVQFFGKIAVPPSADFPCYRMNNFMDGSNGVYRYGYKSLGTDNGYGPYQNSAALLMGWWGFLETDKSRAMYRQLADQYPWPAQCVDLYLGPTAGGRQRSQAELDPHTSEVKLRYLLVRLASEL